MYSYDFPYVSDFLQFQAGMPVSIDRRGNAWPGAGTTIYRNVTNEEIDYDMNNVKLRELNFFMTLAVYDGGVTAFRGTWEGFEVSVGRKSLPEVGGEMRRVSDVVKLSHNRFVVVSPNALLPLTAEVTRAESGRVSVEFYFGHNIDLPEGARWPHLDKLDNDTMAMIFERNMYLYTCLAKVSGAGSDMTITYTAEQYISAVYEFHKVAGMDRNHFIIAASGRMFNISGYPPTITAMLCRVTADDTIEIGVRKYLPWTFSHNFMDIDNFNRDNAVMTFVEGGENAIKAVMVYLDRSANEIFFGSSRTIQSGGAIFHPERIDVRILSETTFSVFYEDQAIGGLCLVLCTVTDTRDIAITSPTYVIEKYRRGQFSYDVSESGMGDFMIIEYYRNEQRRRAMVHYGVVYPRPFGIAQKAKNNRLTVQFAGMFKVPGKQRFIPGRAVYTNSKAELIQGRPYGSANRENGVFYSVAPDGSLLSQNNVVGVAVTRNKIYMKFI